MPADALCARANAGLKIRRLNIFLPGFYLPYAKFTISVEMRRYNRSNITQNIQERYAMSLFKRVGIILLFGLLSNSFAYAQQTAIDGVPFKLGDDVPTVKAALKTDLDPEPMERNAFLPPTATDLNRGKSVLHLRTRGIWAFFSAAGKVETIRLDAPFAGAVKGVHVGDSLSKLTSALGQPLKTPWGLGGAQTYQFALDDSAYSNFSVGNDGVQIIFITR